MREAHLVGWARMFHHLAALRYAPSSTKSEDKARDPDMHQTKKGNQCYFGMKAHVGVDSKTKIIHSVAINRNGDREGVRWSPESVMTPWVISVPKR